MFFEPKNLILRALEFLFTIIILGVCGAMISNSIGRNPSSVKFAMATAVISLITLVLAFAAMFLSRIRSMVPRKLPMVMMAADALTTLFSFCAAVALSARLGAHSCSDNNYTRLNPITRGSLNRTGRCRSAQATTAFLWFNFAAFAASTFLSFLVMRRERAPVVNSASVVGSGMTGPTYTGSRA